MVYRSEADDSQRSGQKVCTFRYGLYRVIKAIHGSTNVSPRQDAALRM